MTTVRACRRRVRFRTGAPDRLHPLLSRRFSPTCFDRSHQANAREVELLLDAARWSPSAGNSQPWAFIVGHRGDDVHERLVGHLARSSAAWAPDASVLVANLAHVYVEGTDWEFSEFSRYDLGQSVAHMIFQAQAMGLFAHQFRAFDRAAIAADFAVPSHWEVTTMSAIGPPCFDQATSSSPGPRARRDRSSLVWTGSRELR
jgi:nitroreductase